MAEFESIYAQQIASTVSLINDINSHFAQQQGKHLRPMLTLLSAGVASGSVVQNKVSLAVAMELLHNSSLIHDDVVDESDLRRGQSTINNRWGNKIAVLCGDFYLSNAVNLLCQHACAEELRIVSRTAREMSEGELIQQQSSHRRDFGIDTYRNTIYKKTASLISTCCEIGAFTPQDTVPTDTLRNFGTHFGMAFQMLDDMLDYMPNTNTGKPHGNDIKEFKTTLPLILYMKQASEDEQRLVVELFKEGYVSDTDAQQLIGKVTDSGALDQAAQAVAQEVCLAHDALKTLPESPYKEELLLLTNNLKIDKQ